MEHMVTSDNIKIYYNIKGEGIPIIFIHGFSENHTCFRIQERVLSKQYKIITYDLRGHGQSSSGDKGLNLERFALDLKELIDYLQLDQVNLVGWSMGGSIIFEYIRNFGLEKLSKICIVDKGPKMINDNNWNLGLYHGEYTREDTEKDLNLMKDNWMDFGESFIKTMAPYFNEDQMEIAREKLKLNDPGVMYSMWESMIEKDYRDILNKISIPTLILFGENSTLYSIEAGEYLRDNIRDSKLIVFEDCTHLLVLENPLKFNRVLSEFIEEKTYLKR